MAEQVPSKELDADKHLEQAENNAMLLVTQKPHPRDYGGVVVESQNGPVWVIDSQHDRLLYHRDCASYWRSEAVSARTTLTGISTCSTCEACRGAALLALGTDTNRQSRGVSPSSGQSALPDANIGQPSLPFRYKAGDRVEWTNFLHNTFSGVVITAHQYEPKYVIKLDDGTLGLLTESELRAAQPPSAEQ